MCSISFILRRCIRRKFTYDVDNYGNVSGGKKSETFWINISHISSDCDEIIHLNLHKSVHVNDKIEIGVYFQQILTFH